MWLSTVIVSSAAGRTLTLALPDISTMCRVTPLQKALVVELVKKYKEAVCLAIGAHCSCLKLPVQHLPFYSDQSLLWDTSLISQTNKVHKFFDK